MTVGFHILQRPRHSPGITFLCVTLALVLQSLAPPGYMAGSLEDGWPVVLCPEGLPEGFPGLPHHSHPDEGTAGHDRPLDAHCPLGSVLDTSDVASACLARCLVEQNGITPAVGYVSAFNQPRKQPHPSRGPPFPA